MPERLSVIHTLTREKDKSIFRGKILKGRVSKELITSSIVNPSSDAVFECGPDHPSFKKREAKEKGETLSPSFMSSVLSALAEIGVPRNKIKREVYG